MIFLILQKNETLVLVCNLFTLFDLFLSVLLFYQKLDDILLWMILIRDFYLHEILDAQTDSS